MRERERERQGVRESERDGCPLVSGVNLWSSEIECY